MKKRSENGSRKDAKAAKSKKFETISNDQNKSNSKRASFGFGVLDFADLRFICLEVCFGFRYSDFGFLSLVACGSGSLPP